MKGIRKVGILALSLLAGGAQATLIDNLDGTVTDTNAGLMWLQDGNLAGVMNWGAAMTWASGLSVGGYTDWRLPSVTDVSGNGCSAIPDIFGGGAGSDCGYNTDTSLSELAYLFHKSLGNLSYYDTDGNVVCSGSCLVNTAPFTNVQSLYYWSGTEYAPHTSSAWYFSTSNGTQGGAGMYGILYAWAVRSCNAGECDSTVPEPGTVVLLGLGLAGCAARRRHWALR